VLHLAFQIAPYSKVIVDLASRFRRLGQRDEEAALCRVLDNKESLNLGLLSLTHLLVRPFIIFFHFKRVEFGRDGVPTRDPDVSLTDYLIFAHDHLGDAGLCGEDHAQLLRLIMKYVSETDRLDDDEDRSKGREELFQCYYCLYGIKLGVSFICHLLSFMTIIA